MKTATTMKTAKRTRAGKRTVKTAGRTPRTPGRLSSSARMPRAAATDTSNAPRANDQRRTSKMATIEALVRRAEGAAITELMAATGWQEHSIRAALTGLRKAGHAISRERSEGGASHYRIAEVV